MMKRNLLFSLITAIAMMLLCPQSVRADDYTITPLRGTSGSSDSEGYESLFDGDSDTKWCCEMPEGVDIYAIFKVSKDCVLKGYTLIDSNDTKYYYGRHWNSWIIYGANFFSDDDAVSSSTEWTKIQTVSGQQYSGEDDVKDHTYTVEDAGGYQYYMIMVIDAGTSSHTYYEDDATFHETEEGVQQMADINFTFGAACSHKNNDGTSALSTETYYTATCTTGAYSQQICSLCNRVLKTVDSSHPALGHSFGTDGKCTRCGTNVTLSLSETCITLPRNEEKTLTLNTYAESSQITWASSDESVATVDATGKVTAKGFGTADITVTFTGTSISATCKVTVADIAYIQSDVSQDIALTAGGVLSIKEDNSIDEYDEYSTSTINLTVPEGYIVHVTGTSNTEEYYDILSIESGGGVKQYSGEADIDYTSLNSTCMITFTTDDCDNNATFALLATALPFLTDIAYTDAKQADGTYNVNFTFQNKYPETTYTVKEGTETVGTITDGATTLTLKGVSHGKHNYTFTDGKNSCTIACYLGTYNMPFSGTTDITLAANETIHIYDDGGPDVRYSNDCDGTIKLTAPKGYVIHVTGTCAGEEYCDYLTIDSDNTWDCGYDDGEPTDVDYTSKNNTCELQFSADGNFNNDGIALTATAVLYGPIVKLNSTGYATYSSDKDIVVATDGVKAYTATVSDDKITLTAVGDGEYIPAGTGVILYGDGMADADVLFQAPADEDDDMTKETDYANALLPTTTEETTVVDKPATGTVWALGSATSFLKYTGTEFIANRAYLIHELSSGAKMSIVFADDIPTGIKGIENGELTVDNSAAYNALGQRVNTGAKGIVIKNGKKYFVK